MGAGTQPAPGPVRDGARADFVPDPDRGAACGGQRRRQAPYRQASTKAKGLSTLIPRQSPPRRSPTRSMRFSASTARSIITSPMRWVTTSTPKARYFIGDDGKGAAVLSGADRRARPRPGQCREGAGFIVGDQTGISGARVVAGAIRHAHKRGMLPVFVTEARPLRRHVARSATSAGTEGLGRPEMIRVNAGVRVPARRTRRCNGSAEAQAAIDAGE